ncbi:MAG: Nuclear actin-protein involved in chromatin remodeling [Chrysothrix sp. TS-e1954]|nr:MAG: Nuclear actin-protein involved in chromatin remodeling [Chrysothrix sp. TS-e1954]
MESPHEHQQNVLLSRIITNVEKLNEAIVVLNKTLQETNIQNMNVELVAQMFKNYQSNVLFHLEATDNMVHAVDETGPRAPKEPPKKIWHATEPPFKGLKAADPSGHKQSGAGDAIVIDSGSSTVRAGWSFDAAPRFTLPPLAARYKDRKLNRHFMFVGSDIFADGTARGQSKNIYEPGTNVPNNWDIVESVLDYVFVKLGLQGSDGGIGRPVVMTEPVANLSYARKTMNEILFELYSAPKVSYGIDSLFSYSYNKGTTGLVVSSAYTSTHMIPVIDTKPIFAHTTRLNWGRFQSAEYLSKLLRLKYPPFPAKITDPQLEDLVNDHCYVSQDYEGELSRFLDWTGLEERDHIIQWPFTEQVVQQKSEEELARQAEKRKEGGRRLQEQAAKMRLEKLVRKEQEVEYYKKLLEDVRAAPNKKEKARMLESDDFDEESQLEKKIKEMERSIRKARNKDVGDLENEPEEPPTYPLLDTPDAELDEEGIKQKRQQRLLKSNHDARARAKAEKEREKARLAEEARLDTEYRENDLDGWLEERRASRQLLHQRIKDRDRFKADLGNRKSLASQMRMKNIANLASDTVTKKRRRGNDEDTFGADDNDWGVYRQIAMPGDQSDDEDEGEDLTANLKNIEAQLLEFDPTFSESQTHDAQKDWTKSLMHVFLHGPWPHDPESQREMHQVHLNVERIRVPEAVFQPSIAGVDQAGVVEIVGDILTQRLRDEDMQSRMLKDIFLTGGNTMFQGFDERMRSDLRALLPAEAPMKVRKAKDPILDAWKGAAKWASSDASKSAFVSRAEYMEKGSDYLKVSFDSSYVMIRRLSVSATIASPISTIPTKLRTSFPHRDRLTMTKANIQVRPALPTDAPSISQLGSTVFRSTFSHSVPAAQMNAYLSEAYTPSAISAALANPNMHIFVAYTPAPTISTPNSPASQPPNTDADAEILGFAHLTLNTSESCVSQYVPAGLIELQRLYISESAQGTGVGTALVTRAQEWALGRGLRWMWLGVWEENPKARRCYERWGWTVVGDHGFDVGGRVDRDLVMVKAL